MASPSLPSPRTRPAKAVAVPPKQRGRAKLAAVPPLSRETPAGGGRSEMEQAIADLPAEFLVCRDLQHHWQIWTARRAKDGFEQVYRCGSCQCTRSRLLDRRGALIQERRHYPEGYLVKGLGRLAGTDRDVVRLTQVLRDVAADDAANPPARKKR